MQADALIDLADVLRHTRPDEARVVLEDALERYEQKGNAVSAARVRALLWELSRETAEERSA
jgi:hypothetical protein